MKKGTTFGELMIVLLIIIPALIIFLRLTFDYLKTLVFSRELFILNSILHSKYQFLIAYRNKALEQPFMWTSIQQVPMPNFNFNCIQFDTENGRFVTSSEPECRERIGNLEINYRITTSSLSNVGVNIRITGNVKTQFGGINAVLQGILTRWHPAIQ